MNEMTQSHDVAVYGGYVDDERKLMQCTSGGIATALAEQAIEKGGYVAGVAYSEDFYKAEYILTNKKTDLDKLKGSKYIEVEKNNIYKNVKALIEQGESVLFIGLPCIVASLYKFLGERPENLLTCELICHGPTSAKVHREYVLHLEKLYNSKVDMFSVRRKKNGWLPAYLYARFENGEEFEKPFNETEYGFAFSVLGRESCYNCRSRGDNRSGDIMVGDFWGATKEDVFWNDKGVSVIFAETEKGNAAITELSGVKLFPTTFERAVKHNPMVIRSKEKSPKREKFAELFEKKGLIYAAKNCEKPKKSIRSRISKLIPQKIKCIIKKICRR